jgi:hypothetical protein
MLDALFRRKSFTTLANRFMIAALTSVSASSSGFGDIRNATEGWMNVPLIAGSLLLGNPARGAIHRGPG